MQHSAFWRAVCKTWNAMEWSGMEQNCYMKYSDFIMHHVGHGMWIQHKDNKKLVSLSSCVAGNLTFNEKIFSVPFHSIPIHSIFYTVPFQFLVGTMVVLVTDSCLGIEAFYEIYTIYVVFMVCGWTVMLKICMCKGRVLLNIENSGSELFSLDFTISTWHLATILKAYFIIKYQMLFHMPIIAPQTQTNWHHIW